MNWVDGVILLYLGFYLWQGRRRGFFLVLLDLVGFFVPILVAITFQGRLAVQLAKWLPLKDFVWKRLQELLPVGAVTVPLDHLPLADIKGSLALLGLPPELARPLQEVMGASGGGAGTTANLLNSLAEIISGLVASLLAFLILFWGTGLIFNLIKAHLAPILWKIDLFGLNRLGGVVLGLLQGALNLSLTLGFIKILVGLGGAVQVLRIIQTSKLAGFFLASFDRVLPIFLRGSF